MWFNNFVEFERNKKQPNRLIMNFYSPDKKKSVKVLVPQKVKIPTGFLIRKRADGLAEVLEADDTFAGFPVSRKRKGRFDILSIEMPYELPLIHELPGEFQIGNYDKLLRFAGFHPERKVTLSHELEARFQEEDDVELDDLEGIDFQQEFPSDKELQDLPYLCIDIEKPLWKKDEERPLLEERNKLLKQEKKYQRLKAEYEKSLKYAQRLHTAATRRQWKSTEKGKGSYQRWLARYNKNKGLSQVIQEEDEKHEARQTRIRNLEKQLTIEVEGVGKVGLYEDRFNADISFVTTIWRDKGEEIKELLVVDPHGDIDKEEHNGYKLLTFETEKELVKALTDRLHKRKPLVSVGHNEVYDISQLTFAAEHHKMKFDPAVKHIKPRRDFVRKFLQRLREDMIYFDTLWLNKNFFAPELQQRSFGTSLKLDAVARHYGLDFKKGLTHEELRYEEIRRLAGETKETRLQARDKLLNYAGADVDNTDEIAKRMDFLPLLTRLKNLLPSCTLSELAFSPNCMKKVHEERHFQESGNLPYYGYKTKIRENERQIFKKRYPWLKRKRLEKSGFANIRGNHKNVREYYFCVEEGMRDIAFTIEPRLEPIYGWAREQGGRQMIAFLQYLKNFMKEPLTDYYFARRDGVAFFHARDFFKARGNPQEGLSDLFKKIDQTIDKKTLDSLKGSFKYLKTLYRSVYVDLQGDKRDVIRLKKGLDSLEEMEFPEFAEIGYPKVAKHDANLYLLRRYSEDIRADLSSSQRRNLSSFLNNFEKFEGITKEAGKKLQSQGITARNASAFDILYAYLYNSRCEEDDKMLWAKYRTSVKEINDSVKAVYNELSANLTGDRRLVDFQGDYLFIQSQEDLHLPNLHYIRHLPEYIVGKNPSSRLPKSDPFSFLSEQSAGGQQLHLDLTVPCSS